jgi:transglutaminase-like putative cysteine protease/predicted Zn-dependent protease
MIKSYTFLRSSVFLILTLLCSSLYAQTNLQNAWQAFFDNKRDDARALFTASTQQDETAAEGYLGLSLLAHLDRPSAESFDNFQKFCSKSKYPQPYIYALWSTESVNPTAGKKKPEELAFFKSITENKDYDGMLAAMASSMIGKHFESSNQFDKADAEYNKIGSIDKWQIAGEFENISTSGFDRKFDPIDHPEADAVFTTKHGAKIGWHDVTDLRHDKWLDFTFYANAENAIVYSQTFVKADREQDVQFRIGVSGSVKVWVNDALLLAVPEERNNDLDSYIQDLKLNKGYNRILVQIGESYAGRSNFMVRLTDNNGHPIPNLVCEAKARPYVKAAKIVSQKTEPFAITYFEGEIKKKPEAALPKMLLAKAYLRNERTYEARLLIEELRKKYPNSSFLNIMLYEVFNKENNRTGSETIKETIKNIDPTLPDALIWKYTEYNTQKDYDKAADVIKQIEKQMPELGAFLYENKISLAGKNKNQNEVIKLGEEAYLKFPDNKDFVELKYAIEKQVKKNPNALDVLKTYVDNNDDYSVAKELSDAYFTAGNAASGIKVLQDQIKNKPYGTGIYSNLGNQYYNLQQYDKSEECYLNCIRIAPTISTYYSSLGKINEMSNHKDKAIQYYQKCLDLNQNDYESIKALRKLQDKKDVFSYFKEPDLAAIIKNAPKAADYPDDNVVTLNEEVQKVVYAQGGSEQKTFITIKILNQKGIDSWKEYAIDYDKWEDLVVETAEVIKANGSKVPAETNDNNLVFTNLEIGDVINVRYKTSSYSQGKLAGYFWDSYYFSSGRPFVKSKYSLLISKNQKFSYKFSQTPITPVKTTVDDFDMYVWEKDKQESLQYEDKMPPLDDVANILYLTSIPDWKFISEWYNDLASAKARTNYEVKEVVRNLFNGQPGLTPIQKIEKIYDYITKNISYSEVSFRQSGLIPQNPADVINTRIGDCKDVSTLFVTMCKEAGIPAQLVLVKTHENGVLAMPLPSIDFNHCMAKVVLNNRDYYIELTSQYLPFGSLYNSSLNSTLLDINDASVSSTRYLDPTTRKANNVKRNTTVSFKDKDMIIDEKTYKTAAIAGSMRESLGDLSTKDQIKNMKESLASLDADNEISKLKYRNIDRKSPGDTVYMDLGYELKNYLKTIGGIYIFTLPWSGKISAGDLQITLPRYSNIDLSQMFYLDNETETITVNLVPGKKMVEAITPVVLKNDIIEYSIIPKQVGNKVLVTRTFKLLKEVVPAARAAEFNIFFKKMVDSDNKEFAMK